jgi:hypothetical protein
LESNENSKIWTGLQRRATEGVPPSPQLFSAEHGSKTLHCEWTLMAAALLGALESNESSKIQTGLWRWATKGAPSSLQFDSAKHGSKTL